MDFRQMGFCPKVGIDECKYAVMEEIFKNKDNNQ